MLNRFYVIVIYLLLMPLPGYSAPPGWSEYPAPGRLVPVGNHKLHVNCSGQGSPLVVLDSGLGGTSLDWAYVQPEIAAFTRVCSYDRAGHGWSERGPAPRTSAVFISELAQLLRNALEAPPYIMVGHSLGGFTARGFAHFYPDQVAGLVLVDSSHEQQFQKIAATGYAKPLAPSRSKGFVISNSSRIPVGIPAELRTVAQRLALLPDAVRTLYDELGAMRLSARQAASWLSLPDVPLVVLAHDSFHRPARIRHSGWRNNGCGYSTNWPDEHRKAVFSWCLPAVILSSWTSLRLCLRQSARSLLLPAAQCTRLLPTASIHGFAHCNKRWYPLLTDY
ncbi:MAG: alpha/beta fold hydrolase [Gammaproteobacteria bacterium]